VLTWKTAVVHVKGIVPGDTVSYGRNYTAAEPRIIATLPVGYGDGYKRCISNKAEVLIHGKRAPIVGTVCMDQCMADVTEIDDVKPGDEVVLIGCQGDECIGADEMAEWAGTTKYCSASTTACRAYSLDPIKRLDHACPGPRRGGFVL
jgi:alanine racemase